MRPSRRAVLAGGTGAILLGLGAPGASRAGPPAPRRALRVLDVRTFSILAAVADRICPGGDGLPSAWALEVPEQVDAFLDRIDPASAAEVGQVLLLLESGLLGLALDGRIRPFTSSAPEVQDRILDGWRTSRWTLRSAAWKALASAVSAAYWADPRTWAHLGYPGPPRFPS